MFTLTEEDSNCGWSHQRKRIVLANFGCDQKGRWCTYLLTLFYPSIQWLFLSSGATEFRCPEEFGYYQHPTECSLYYVCVFGGPLLESCTGGLVYSHDLQTCDWPRNVACKTETPEPPTDNQINTDTLEDLEAPLSLHSKKVSPGRLSFGVPLWHKL